MFIIDFNDLIIKKIYKNNIILVKIYDSHNYNFNFSQNM